MCRNIPCFWSHHLLYNTILHFCFPFIQHCLAMCLRNLSCDVSTLHSKLRQHYTHIHTLTTRDTRSCPLTLRSESSFHLLCSQHWLKRPKRAGKSGGQCSVVRWYMMKKRQWRTLLLDPIQLPWSEQPLLRGCSGSGVSGSQLWEKNSLSLVLGAAHYSEVVCAVFRWRVGSISWLLSSWSRTSSTNSWKLLTHLLNE